MLKSIIEKGIILHKAYENLAHHYANSTFESEECKLILSLLDIPVKNERKMYENIINDNEKIIKIVEATTIILGTNRKIDYSCNNETYLATVRVHNTLSSLARKAKVYKEVSNDFFKEFILETSIETTNATESFSNYYNYITNRNYIYVLSKKMENEKDPEIRLKLSEVIFNSIFLNFELENIFLIEKEICNPISFKSASAMVDGMEKDIIEINNYRITISFIYSCMENLLSFKNDDFLDKDKKFRITCELSDISALLLCFMDIDVLKRVKKYFEDNFNDKKTKDNSIIQGCIYGAIIEAENIIKEKEEKKELKCKQD